MPSDRRPLDIVLMFVATGCAIAVATLFVQSLIGQVLPAIAR